MSPDSVIITATLTLVVTTGAHALRLTGEARTHALATAARAALAGRNKARRHTTAGLFAKTKVTW